MKRLSGTLLGLLAVLPFVYIAMPIVTLLWGNTATDVHQALGLAEVRDAFLTSASSAATTTLVASIIGLPCAFVMARLRSGWKRALEGLVVLPLVLPPLVGGMAELSVFGPNTWIGQAAANVGLSLTNSWLGVVLAQLFVTMPFIILAAKAGFEDVPAELPEAASLSGAGLWTQWIYIYIPIAARAILAGILLTLTRAFGEFGATMMMAYHPYTVPVDLYVQFSAGGLGALLPIAGLVVIVSLLVVIGSGVLAEVPRRR